MLITLRFQAKEIDDGYAEVYVLTKKPTSKKLMIVNCIIGRPTYLVMVFIIGMKRVLS